MKIYYKYLLVVVWMIAIFLLSNEVSEISSGRSGVIVSVLVNSFHADLSETFLTFLTRKAAHIIAYLILGILLFNVIQGYKLSLLRTVLLSIVIALGYAVLDEVHQLFVPGRSGELRDVFIDTAAALVGIGAYYLIHNTLSSRVNSKNEL